MLQSSHDELHNLAAHAHQGAATAHGKGDHLSAHELQGKPKNTLGRLTRNRPTFASSWNKPAAKQGNSSIGTLESREDL